MMLVQNAVAWPSLAEVHRLMAQATTFEPVVVTIPRHWGGRGPLRDEDETHRDLEHRGVPHLRVCEGMDPLKLLRLLSQTWPFGSRSGTTTWMSGWGRARSGSRAPASCPTRSPTWSAT